MQKQGNLGWFWLMSDCHWHIPCNQNTTVVPAWYLSRFSACHATHLGQMAKIRQKINSKNLWNWLTSLMPATVWREDDVKIIPLPETEVLWKIREITSNIMKWIYFWWVLAIRNHCVPSCCAECIAYSHRLLALQSSYMLLFFSICRNKNVVYVMSQWIASLVIETKPESKKVLGPV